MSLEGAIFEVQRISKQIQELEAQSVGFSLQPQVAQAKAQLHALQSKLNPVRGQALKLVQAGDVRSLLLALAIPPSLETGPGMSLTDACMAMGIGSLKALLACTRNQFRMLSRFHTLGWGDKGTTPPTLDLGVVVYVERVLNSMGCRWREAEEPMIVKLPEPVMSKNYNKSFDVKARFKPQDFMAYAHPDLVTGGNGRFEPLVPMLNRLGVYSWEDLSFRSIPELKRLGVVIWDLGGQLDLVVYEMKRRGLPFKRELVAQKVDLDVMETDRINTNSMDVKTQMSYEDRIKVRDGVGKIVKEISEDNAYKDRVGIEYDGKQEMPSTQTLGVAEEFVEEEIEEDVPSNEEGA